MKRLSAYQIIRPWNLALLWVFLSLASLQGLSKAEIETLSRSLDPESIGEQFAFYQLYPDTVWGREAYRQAWKLLQKHRKEALPPETTLHLPPFEIEGIISLVSQAQREELLPLTLPQLEVIETTSNHLANRELKGFQVTQIDEILSLPPEEIDLSRALLLLQFEGNLEKIRLYEASLDLMALQILARLPLNPTNEEKIRALSHFIFTEKKFRFPPHSLYASEIDTYTFLSSVIESRLGVCLGVSILYLTLADRLAIPLEVITPPGHIYLSYQGQNIETTARGVHFPDHTYLGINTRKLQKRNKKELIGLTLLNEASVAWQKNDHTRATALYEKALPFFSDDHLVKLLLGYNYLFIGKKKEGKQLLREVSKLPFDHAVSKETTPEDYLQGKVDAKGIQLLFMPVDEHRESILTKQKALEKVLKKYPHFRDGLLQLATTYMQLGESTKALKALKKYHALDPTSPVTEYYLAILSIRHFQYEEAWHYLENVKRLTEARGHAPHCLKSLSRTLQTLYQP